MNCIITIKKNTGKRNGKCNNCNCDNNKECYLVHYKLIDDKIPRGNNKIACSIECANTIKEKLEKYYNS